MRVRVYWNVHRGVWSILAHGPKGWRLADHSPDLALQDARFLVSAAGRARCLRLGKKVVHAYVEGNLVEGPGYALPGLDWPGVRYNPRRGPAYFHTAEGERVDRADFVAFLPDRSVRISAAAPHSPEVRTSKK